MKTIKLLTVGIAMLGLLALPMQASAWQPQKIKSFPNDPPRCPAYHYLERSNGVWICVKMKKTAPSKSMRK